jgi:hypothetical protein
MDPVVALSLIPFSLGRLEVIGMFGLETSALNEFAAIGSVGLIRVILLGKNRLDVMIPLIVGALNPDSFCLIYCRDSHDFLPL